VIKRNGTVVPYTDDKITVAITKAFLAVEGGTAAASSRIHDTVARLTEQVTATFKRRMPSGGTIHIEEIQDQVELALMRAGEQKVARDYVIYRDQRAKSAPPAPTPAPWSSRTQASASPWPTAAWRRWTARLNTIISEACEGLAEVDGDLIQRETLKNLYDGVALKDVNTALVMTARTLVEREPNYSFVTARLLMDTLRAEGLGFLGVADSATHHEMADLYAKALPAYVAKGIEFELLNPALADLRPGKTGQGDQPRARPAVHLPGPADPVRPLLHPQGWRPLRTAAGVLHARGHGPGDRREDKEDRAIEFYNLLSSFDYMARPRPCSTPAPCVRSCRAAT
jgi:ribonucleoside-diphosphate reductase alpha chain